MKSAKSLLITFFVAMLSITSKGQNGMLKLKTNIEWGPSSDNIIDIFQDSSKTLTYRVYENYTGMNKSAASLPDGSQYYRNYESGLLDGHNNRLNFLQDERFLKFVNNSIITYRLDWENNKTTIKQYSILNNKLKIKNTISVPYFTYNPAILENGCLITSNEEMGSGTAFEIYDSNFKLIKQLTSPLGSFSSYACSAAQSSFFIVTQSITKEKEIRTNISVFDLREGTLQLSKDIIKQELLDISKMFVIDSVILIYSLNKKHGGQITAYDFAGKEMWALNKMLPFKDKNIDVLRDINNPINIYAITFLDELSSINIKSGQVEWSKKLGEQYSKEIISRITGPKDNGLRTIDFILFTPQLIPAQLLGQIIDGDKENEYSYKKSMLFILDSKGNVKQILDIEGEYRVMKLYNGNNGIVMITDKNMRSYEY